MIYSSALETPASKFKIISLGESSGPLVSENSGFLLILSITTSEISFAVENE